ncbi:MAG: cardiolipin synthase [Rubripirellula sp.]
MITYNLVNPTTVTWVIHSILAITLTVRVIMKRPSTGVALAWLLVINAIPILGALTYLLIGERRISPNRVHGIAKLRNDYRGIIDDAVDKGLIDVDWSRHSEAARNMSRLGWNLVGSPTVAGSSFQLFDETPEMLRSIVRDVDGATTSVLMEFYIWNKGGLADDVLEAFERASQRGVHCCLLVDAVGARPWWKTSQPKRLRDAGVEVRPALPVGLFRTLVGRTDLRLHRKIIVVDSAIAWTGSMNLVDPRFFKQDSGVGEWVDAMVRLEGAVVAPLAATLIGDWILEGSDTLADMIKRHQLHMVDPNGSADIQVIPSGPGETSDGLLQMILTMINGARHELVLTTPYLVPDESLLRAIRGASARGVHVRVIVPEKVDSFLTRYASRSYYDDLLDNGVEIYLYRDGLLHTKSIFVDGKVSMFGTVNLDMRSLWLNYEVALFLYDPGFAAELRKLQQSYLDESDQLDKSEWENRSFGNRFLENTLRLVGPLL